MKQLDRTIFESYIFILFLESYTHGGVSGSEFRNRDIKYIDWSQRDDIKADLIITLAENDYPPVGRDEVYKEIFEQAENFKRYRGERYSVGM